jgi:hypothetical protein
MKTTTLRAFTLSTGLTLGLATPALAHLGSFSPSYGYNINVPSGGSANWCDVSYYNAGTYGANSGGGSGPTALAPDSGLWRVVGPIGGFFPSTAARNTAISGAPPYPTTVPPGTVAAYMVGQHFPGRGGDGANLAFRNDTPAGTGDAKYEYSLDAYDMGGFAPASITSGTVGTQFYFMPDPGVAPHPGAPARDKFVLSLKDSIGNIGVQWGYADDNEVYWRTNTSGAWNYTGVYATIADWDGVKLDVDLTNDTFGIDYYDVTTNTWSTMVPSGTVLGAAMQDLTVLGWQLADAVSMGTGGKNYFDDFSFNVPEPSSLALVLAGLAVMARRRA